MVRSVMDRRDVLRTSEVADILGVSIRSVRRLCDSGKLKSYRVGTRKDRLFDPVDVKVFAASEIPGWRDCVSPVVVFAAEEDHPEVVDVVSSEGFCVVASDSSRMANVTAVVAYSDADFLVVFAEPFRALRIHETCEAAKRGPVQMVAVLPSGSESIKSARVTCLRHPVSPHELAQVLAIQSSRLLVDRSPI